ncbi:MAG TPA: cytochrome c3 family protein [Coriobacteriia bacterium]|nr:cytochrome c3 family protein [Coriobacteriia bacterium]
MSRYLRLAIVTAAVLLVSAAPAFAYQESKDSTLPANTPAYACPTCHGLDDGETSPTVAPTRKGPHGGYTSGTNKCETCHTLHGAASARMLLPQQTISDTCNTCHDGTGGGGVYGVIARRTGKTAEQIGGHAIGKSTDGKVTVPGGDPSGGSLERVYSGESGGLTCTDCHDPHDAKTVAPFVGDRKRYSNDTSASVATNRLLRDKPTSAETTVAVYGSDWCESCHKGASRGGMTHPVAGSPDADYMNVTKLAGYDTTQVASSPGRLGGSNLGYVVPSDSGKAPICQQCHEDGRAIANDSDKPLSISSETEDYYAPADGNEDGNPRFQNFPHETVNDKLLIETGDSLCLNCHDQTPAGAVH